MGSASGRDTVDVLGVAVDRVTMLEAVERVESMMASSVCRQSGSEMHHVVTVNSEMVMMARERPDFAQILAQASLVVPDGIGVVWGARLLGDYLPERVAGIDLMDQVLAACAKRGWRPFLLGAAPGVAEQAAAALQRRHAGLEIAGVHHGYFNHDEEATVLEQIESTSPDLLLVAMGAPRQEYWIARHRHRLPVALAVGVGGSLDVWAGHVTRAPRWMREVGLEWAYRLLRQPRRILRMAALPRFALTVLSHRFFRGRR
ncbi:MAG: WecB/TagA/CpsF family glycosyltransferase [Firmicutes bacterium]|nr:WecB/TagA/CpsF family glycosyltransferase [Bacillota bacterium]